MTIRYSIFAIFAIGGLFLASSQSEPVSRIQSLSRREVTREFRADTFSRHILLCYGQPRLGGTAKRSFESADENRKGEFDFSKRYTLCGQLTREPSDFAGHYIPSIGTITDKDYQRSKAAAAEQLRLFVCERVRTALLGGSSSPQHECPNGEQILSTYLFMEVTTDLSRMFPTAIALIYGRSEYLAIRREKYWERYRFSFQAIESGVAETTLVVAIDEAKEEKNGDDKKLIQFRSPIGDEHIKEVEALFNRITLAAFGKS
jgi:hypothetical protein